MGKSDKKKKPEVQSKGGGRAANKPPSKHKKPNGVGSTGRTIGGYTPAKIAERAIKRQNLGVIRSFEG